MRFILRDATTMDIPTISAIYRHSVVNGTASYEIDPPTGKEMAKRFAGITGKGYPYLAAADETGAVIGYAG